MSNDNLYCTFFLGRQAYGVAVRDVREVLMSQPLTSVPLAPVAVSGLMNLRGQIVSAVNLRQVLQVDGGKAMDDPMNVVVTHEGTEVSLQVDRIGDVIDVSSHEIERPPETLQGDVRGFITGICAMEKELLLLLDIHRLLEDESCTQSVLSLEKV